MALALSLALSGVQLLPLIESAGFKELQQRYGGGIRSLRYYSAYLIPNYFDFALEIHPYELWLRIPVYRSGRSIRNLQLGA